MGAQEAAVIGQDSIPFVPWVTSGQRHFVFFLNSALHLPEKGSDSLLVNG